MRRLTYIFLAVIIIAGGLSLMWFRSAPTVALTFDPAAIGDDIESYLARQEARFDDIRDGLNKRIVWAYPQSRAKTPLSIVYVHGFSASSDEVRPLTDIVAERLGANLFYTRLQGHGRSGEAMAEATVSGWGNDVAEAVEIGRRLGERVILIGTSTGGTLDTWAASQPDFVRDVAGIVHISPNFGARALGSRLLTLPGGIRLAELLQGKWRSFEPKNDLHAHIWTHQYPTSGVLPMAQIVRLVNAAPIENITIPALFIFSNNDQVVRPEMTRSAIERWGAATEVINIDDSDDDQNHVIVGDAMSPSTTDKVADSIVAWIEELPQS